MIGKKSKPAMRKSPREVNKKMSKPGASSTEVVAKVGKGVSKKIVQKKVIEELQEDVKDSKAEAWSTEERMFCWIML